jgi:hypothetical protein
MEAFDKALEGRLLSSRKILYTNELIWIIKSNRRKVIIQINSLDYIIGQEDIWKRFYFNGRRHCEQLIDRAKDLNMDLLLDIIMEAFYRLKKRHNIDESYNDLIIILYRLHIENNLLTFNQFFARFMSFINSRPYRHYFYSHFLTRHVIQELAFYIRNWNDKKMNPIWTIWEEKDDLYYLQWLPEEILDSAIGLNKDTNGKPYQKSLTDPLSY